MIKEPAKNTVCLHIGFYVLCCWCLLPLLFLLLLLLCIGFVAILHYILGSFSQLCDEDSFNYRKTFKRESRLMIFKLPRHSVRTWIGFLKRILNHRYYITRMLLQISHVALFTMSVSLHPWQSLSGFVSSITPRWCVFCVYVLCGCIHIDKWKIQYSEPAHLSTLKALLCLRLGLLQNCNIPMRFTILY